jgi:hypothetical protein
MRELPDLAICDHRGVEIREAVHEDTDGLGGFGDRPSPTRSGEIHRASVGGRDVAASTRSLVNW